MDKYLTKTEWDDIPRKQNPYLYNKLVYMWFKHLLEDARHLIKEDTIKYFLHCIGAYCLAKIKPIWKRIKSALSPIKALPICLCILLLIWLEKIKVISLSDQAKLLFLIGGILIIIHSVSGKPEVKTLKSAKI